MVDRVEQFAAQFMFGNIAGGTCGQRIGSQLFAAMRGQHHNGSRTATLADCPHQLEAIHVGHPHVGEDKIGPLRFDLSDGVFAIDGVDNR